MRAIVLTLIQKEVGAYNYMQMQEGWESFLLGPFTRMLNQTKEQVENTCRELRALFMDPSFHAYYVL